MNDEENKPEAPITEKKEEEEPLSIVEEAKAIRDQIIEAKDFLKAENDRKEKIRSEELLGSSAGGRVESVPVSPEEKKINDAKEYFKDTALGDAIDKSNPKK